MAMTTLLIVTLGIAFISLYVVVQRSELQQLDEALFAHAEEEAIVIVAAAGEIKLSSRPGPPGDDGSSHLQTYAAVYEANGNLVTMTPTFSCGIPSLAAIQHPRGEPFDLHCGKHLLRAVFARIPEHDQQVLLMAVPRTQLDDDGRFFVQTMLIVLVGSVLLAAVVARGLARGLARSQEAIASVARTNFAARIFIFLTLAALLVGPFSAGDLADFVVFQPRLLRHVILENRAIFSLVGIVGILSVIALYKVLQSKISLSLRSILAASVLVFVPICLYIFSFGSSWFEERHLRIPGLLLLTALFELSRAEKRGKLQMVLLFCLFGSSVYGFASWGRHWLKSKELTVSNRTGIRYHSISPAALKLLHRVQNEMPPDFLFASMDHGIALEAPKHRFGLLNGAEEAFETLPKMKGKVRHAMVILPASRLRENDFSRSLRIGESELNCKYRIGTDFVFATQSVCKAVEDAITNELQK